MWGHGADLFTLMSDTDYIEKCGQSRQKDQIGEKKNQNWVTFNCSKRNLRSVDERGELLVEIKTCRLLPLMAHGWPALVNIKSVATHRKRGRSVSLGDSRLPSPTVCRPTLAVAK